MDVFFEQIVAKRNTGIDLVKKIGIVVAALLLIFIFAFILPGFQMAEGVLGIIGQIFSTLGLLLAAGVIYGTYYLISSMSIEYEYILTNGEIDVDKIIARRKRKRLITVDTRQFTEFGLYQNAPQTDSGTTVIMACSSTQDPNTYYALLDHAKFGKCMLVFNPNEKILTNMKQYIKRNIWKA